MKKIAVILVSFTALILTGCIAFSFNLGNKTVLEIKFRPTSNENPLVAIKNNPILRQKCNEKDSFFTWGSTCHLDGSPTNNFTFEYAVMPINRSQVHQIPVNQRRAFELKHIHSLPPSAWRTYTVNLKPIQDEVNRLYRTDPRGTYKFGAKATVALYIDGNGNISQEVDYDRVTKGWLL